MGRHGLVGVTYPSEELITFCRRLVYILGDSLSIGHFGCVYQLIAYVVVYVIYVYGICTTDGHITCRHGLRHFAPSAEGVALLDGIGNRRDGCSVLDAVGSVYLTIDNVGECVGDLVIFHIKRAVGTNLCQLFAIERGFPDGLVAFDVLELW